MTAHAMAQIRASTPVIASETLATVLRFNWVSDQMAEIEFELRPMMDLIK